MDRRPTPSYRNLAWFNFSQVLTFVFNVSAITEILLTIGRAFSACFNTRIRDPYKFYKKMFPEPVTDVLGMILDSYRRNGEIELEIAKEISEMEPVDAGNYVQLAHYFASMDKWDGVWGVLGSNEISWPEESSGCASRKDEENYNQATGILVDLSSKLECCRDRLRQSGPRPDSRLLRQTALEVLTRSARSDSPRKTRPEQNSGEVGRRRRKGGGGGGGLEKRGRRRSML
ncbi:pentatricopeptide repeat-containing protein [Dorcoceras hygrometricum]|uniref:Pentatricopeptide repeat-containing protein n=1 Tax=Dorcoceras hygrometricum TaxID=472368 RepID=A0A2Z7D1Z8_9LAMI|nr:pentatricopeptide repeat-containing protein [Dorcoceras hygrometricum]